MKRRKYFNKMSPADFWALLLGCLAVCHAAPTFTQKVSPEEEDAVQVTGVLSSGPVEMQIAPQCGVPEVNRYELPSERPKWEKSLITYRITEYTSDLNQSQVDTTIAQAFKLYSDVVPLNFKQVYNDTADITILFKSGAHGDFHPFDGPGGVLAHAYYPDEGGDTHFDDDETWTLTQSGSNLLLVAAHGFGHALGLDHSNNSQALMYRYYNYVNTNGFRLPDDDRSGIQALYGEAGSPVEEDDKAQNPTTTLAQVGLPTECCLTVVNNPIQRSAVANYHRQISGQGCPLDATILVTRRDRKFCAPADTERWVQEVIKYVDSLRAHCKKNNYKGNRCSGVKP